MSHSTGIHINGKAAIASHYDAIVVGVFATDGAAMVSSACQNPSHTYMALTARAAGNAVSELKRGNL